MTTSENWPTKHLAVANLYLDQKNPRLGRETSTQAPREIVQYLFRNDKTMEVAESIARRGYFPNEPLLAIEEGGKFVVLEGNRRLAALKALREPGILDGALGRQVERIARNIQDIDSIKTVPVTIAPNRRATDVQIAGRHIGTPVLAWQAENRASFILDKLAEGYTADQLRDNLGFSMTDVQEARQTRSIADMARSLELPDEVKAKLDNPRAKLFTTIERVLSSSAGRECLMVKPDPDHGFRGETTKEEFVKGFAKLVTDVALGKQSSRTLNTNDDIKGYFQEWDPKERPSKKRGSFVPTDVIKEKSVSSAGVAPEPKKTGGRSNQESKTVIPKDFKIRLSTNERLIDLRKELTKMLRADYPNAGAVMLRVFLELSIKDYFERIGEMTGIVARIEKKEKRKLPYGVPTWKQLTEEIIRVAKAKLPSSDATIVEKALKRDNAAPFTISDLNAFVHSSDLPGERDIQQFWLRTAPLFRMMLERDPKP